MKYTIVNPKGARVYKANIKGTAISTSGFRMPKEIIEGDLTKAQTPSGSALVVREFIRYNGGQQEGVLYILKNDVIPVRSKTNFYGVAGDKGDRKNYNMYKIVGYTAKIWEQKSDMLFPSSGGLNVGEIIMGKPVNLTLSGTAPNTPFIQVLSGLYAGKYIFPNNVVISTGHNFSGADGASNKLSLGSGAVVMGVGFGLLGTGVGVMLGAGTKGVIGLAGAGVVLGGLIGSGMKGESFSGADGKRTVRGKSNSVQKDLWCKKWDTVFLSNSSKCPKGTTVW